MAIYKNRKLPLARRMFEGDVSFMNEEPTVVASPAVVEEEVKEDKTTKKNTKSTTQDETPSS